MTQTATLRRINEVRMGFLILTRIPVGRIKGEVPTMAASCWGWPLIGAFIGLVAAVVGQAAMACGFSGTISALLAVIVTVLLTGAIHEDGLADLFDGLGGGRTKERALEIMRDSRIGSYGALALLISVLLRCLLIAQVAPSGLVAPMIGLAAFSRGLMPVALWLMPAARDNGLGHAAGGVGHTRPLIALAIGGLCLMATGPLTTLVAALAASLAALLVAGWAKARIGGQTGDVLGSIQQVAELAGWLVIAARV